MVDTMRLHYLQHVPFENAGNIEAWAKANGHAITKTVLYYDEAFPGMGEFDWLVIMGGPMNVYEERDYPFLRREKAFIREAVAAKKLVLGICLGGQLLSDVLGGRVTAGEKEIGWHRVRLTPEARQSSVFKDLPQELTVFQWHGDTFSIPPGAKRMASSDACENQAFEYGGGRVVGLQFHLESTDDGINRLAKSCGDDLASSGKFVQKKDDFLHKDAQLKEIYALLAIFLDSMAKA